MTQLVADLPLLAWADVPEGHYVWARWKGSSTVWSSGRRAADMVIFAVGVFSPDHYEFCAAEQQPGDAVYWHAESTKDCKRADAAEAALTRLRDGLAALEQKWRKYAATTAMRYDRREAYESAADDIAALREG